MVGVSQDLCIESLQADDGHGKELRQEESLVKLLGSDLWALPHQDLVFEHLLDFHICVIASQLVSKEDEERRYFVSTQYLGKLLLLLQHLLLGVIISQLVLKRNEGIKCHFNIYYPSRLGWEARRLSLILSNSIAKLLVFRVMILS